ncbi:ATP synthase complex subunit H-domain-containing protein [Gymnopilus junonius]|uniref:ATP synthase complex subunit H-domain-containing protein n=1 Tax=Gymnopilus junonius TaxID=109634 RepID=A0A9P5NL65_GYMJU|nr:ATP synthase complex subunit H-domain-containing protein [Gymnopilus junonius]
MSSILRQSAAIARKAVVQRTFASSAVSRKDIVQDLYLREIKAYKPAPVAKDSAAGSVKKFTPPPRPTPPALPSDLAAELSAYDAAEPTSSSVPAAQTSTTEGVNGADAFLAFLEQDLPKPVAHH